MLLFFCVSLACLLYSSAERNDRPVIGILAQEIRSPKPNQTAYIAASYVKFLESGGARVVPVMLSQTLEEYKRLFNSINGILYPGGRSSIISSRYQRAAQIFYELAVEWHPEKNAFEWRNPFVPHSPSAIKTTFYLAEFFVGEARRSFHRFRSEEEERKALIYNYDPVYTRPQSLFEQMYLFG